MCLSYRSTNSVFLKQTHFVKCRTLFVTGSNLHFQPTQLDITSVHFAAGLQYRSTLPDLWRRQEAIQAVDVRILKR